MTNEIVVKETGEIIDVPSIFGTQDVIKKATEVANLLAPIIEQKKLYKTIPNKKDPDHPSKHVYVDGWTTMGAMLGVFPRTAFSKRVEREGEIIYESRVELFRTSGEMVGAGEAVCSSRENNWGYRDEYAIKSMSQTRATGKAYRLSFSWIMGLAGYSSTPAEEMAEEKPAITMPKAIPAPAIPAKKPGVISEGQRKLLFAKTKAAGIAQEDFREYLMRVHKIEHTSDLPWTKMDEVLKWIDAADDAPEIPFGGAD